MAEEAANSARMVLDDRDIGSAVTPAASLHLEDVTLAVPRSHNDARQPGRLLTGMATRALKESAEVAATSARDHGCPRGWK